MMQMLTFGFATSLQVMLESNVVLEALGNAKTHRNDNSSRFGKWVALYFSQSGQAVGGKLTTYLLESVRVTRLMQGERNYHCFYQVPTAPPDFHTTLYHLARYHIGADPTLRATIPSALLLRLLASSPLLRRWRQPEGGT